MIVRECSVIATDMIDFKRIILILALAQVGLKSVEVFASGGDRVQGSRFVSGRCAALADSCAPTAMVPTEALMVNPVGIAKIQGFHFEPLLLQAQVNRTVTKHFPRTSTGIYDLDSMKDPLMAQPGLSPGGSFSIFPNIGFRGFAAGVLYQRSVRASYDGTNIVGVSRSQFIPTVGTGFRLASGVLRFGYSLQWVNQASGEVTALPTATDISYGRNLPQGNGLSHNGGFALTLPYRYLPVLTGVARNVGGLKYSRGGVVHFTKDPGGAPATEKASYDAGIGWIYKTPLGVKLAFQGMMRDLSNVSDATYAKRAAVGLEVEIMWSLKLRAGYGSEYPSAGIGFEFMKSNLDIAWTSEDIGTRNSPVRDQRYILQYAFRLF